MMTDAPLILWFRRDLRLADHPMLTAAMATGRPLVPLFILDPETEAQGAATLWRLGLSVAEFARQLHGIGLRLTLRRGAALEVLDAVLAETGAAGVLWSRLYDPVARGRDTAVKAALRARGVEARSFPGHLLHEPWEVETGQGGFYKVFTPYWRAVRQMSVAAAWPVPAVMRATSVWPVSEDLADWDLAAGMGRGAAVVLRYQRVGEAAALDRLDGFVRDKLAVYAARRDYLAEDAGSGLSENLTYGEIGPRQVWHAGFRALQEGVAGAETFLKELVWREFAWHLTYHTPHLIAANWREGWDDFPWRSDTKDAEAWRRGMTGEPVVDAAMRQMYVTGTMHNRARMVVASYLTKHLLTDWRVGQAWFADCLTDWDPASNAMGWQWVAGSGPDAAPYFRIFNPATQAEKFDPAGAYRARWLDPASPEAQSFFKAVPLSWGLIGGERPPPLISLAAGRARALDALAQRKA
ncbi:MAG: deoxyribodipyrimidine photo-lyase [bacterium]